MFQVFHIKYSYKMARLNDVILRKLAIIRTLNNFKNNCGGLPM